MTHATALVHGASEVRLDDLLRDGLFIDGDWVESRDQDPNGEVRLIQLADVGDGVFRNRSSRYLTIDKARELGCTFLEPGDVLIARMPEPLGRACIFPGLGQPAVTVVDVCIARANPTRVRQEWLVKALNSPLFRSSMQQFVRGTTRQRISRRNLGKLMLTVPPTSAQREVAEFVDQIEVRRGSASNHLARARQATDRFRQVILRAACYGELTKDWRHSRFPKGAAAPIAAEPNGSRSHAQPWHGIDASPTVTNDELPFGWEWTRLGSIVNVATGATPLRSRADYYNGSIPWVTSGSVNTGLIAQAAEFISDSAIRETNAKVFPKGTLLVAMYGEGQTRGRVAELGIAAATNQALAALLFDTESEHLRPYLRLFLQQNYEKIRLRSFGGVQPNLSLGVIRDTLIPLPPQVEQAEIVLRANRLMLAVDRVEARIDSGSNQVDRLTQSVLAKAFSPDLVTAGTDGLG